MVLWFTALFYVFFFFIVYILSEWKHLIKVQHLYIFTEFCLLCQVVAHARWSKQLNMLTLSPFPGVFVTVHKIACRAGISLISRVTMAWGPQHGICHAFHGIYVQDRIVSPEINAQASVPISHSCVVSLQSLEWREVGLKESWLVMSFKPHWYDQYLHLQNAGVDVDTPLMSLHWTFHPLSSKETLGNAQMNAWSLPFTYPRGVSVVWCWASDGQFTLCGAFSVLLFSAVCSSRMVVVHLAHLVHMIIQRGVTSVGAMRKHQFWRMIHEHHVCWFFIR